MQALGMIEVVGLVAGVEAADVACKTADVELVGYELAKGGGFVTVKVLGQVGAVNAAMAAAAQTAAKISRVVSTLVIPRPHEQITSLVLSKATIGYTLPAPPMLPELPVQPAKAAAPHESPESAPAPKNTTTRRKSS